MSFTSTRRAAPRRFLMCRPDHFEVTYSINPWMNTEKPVDSDLALLQWEELVRTYLDHGHEVQTIEPLPGQPDMVFAANGGIVARGRALAARFRHHRASSRRTGVRSLVRVGRLPPGSASRRCQ